MSPAPSNISFICHQRPSSNFLRLLGRFDTSSSCLSASLKLGVCENRPLAVARYQSTTSALPCSKSDHELFAYTSGRYLYNEKLQLAERHVPFDVVALKNITANSVGRRHVRHMKKFAEGGFNRVFLLTMDVGFEVIVKIPYSVAAPKRSTKESEVATLDFLYSKGLPVPRVYAWSSGTDNAAGAGYIIMEKAQGHPLELRWFSLMPKERVRLATSYIEIERKMFSLPLVSYGSLYYKSSLPPYLQADLYLPETPDENDDTSRFCIVPEKSKHLQNDHQFSSRQFLHTALDSK